MMPLPLFKRTELAAIAAIVIIFSFPLYSEGNQNKEVEIKVHKCKWAGCDYRGISELPEVYNEIDSIHFGHPEWEYERCEALIKY